MNLFGINEKKIEASLFLVFIYAAVRRAVFPVQCVHWCSVCTAVRSPCNGRTRHVSMNNIKLCEYDLCFIVYFMHIGKNE